MRLHIRPHIGSLRLTRVDGTALNGLYAHLVTAGRHQNWRVGSGYSEEVVNRALELRSEGLSLTKTAEQLRDELPEAATMTKDTLASLLRRTRDRASRESRGAGLDPTTVRYVHTILHRALGDAVRWGRLARNPADAADPPKKGTTVDEGDRAWDSATLAEFLERSRSDGDRLYALWVLLATTGMRRGEALGLRWSDVDLDSGRIRVVQALGQIRSKVSLGSTKTVRGRRPIAIDPATVEVLREHRQRMADERALVGDSFTDTGLVFHQPDGSWLHPGAVSDAFQRRVDRFGRQRITAHGLRHTWATLALEQGVHPVVVQQRLGHASIVITLGTYSHVTPVLHDNAAALVASLILPHAYPADAKTKECCSTCGCDLSNHASAVDLGRHGRSHHEQPSSDDG